MKIRIEGARTHNLKNLTLEIPRNQFVVITGPSGSGKSSLAFDTIFAEGQRQYIESLSLHTRQFLRQLDRPDLDRITGLQPTVAIDQRGRTANPRSTVGTLTEIYDYLRLLYARCGLVHCYQCSRPIRQTPPVQIVDSLMALPKNTRLMLLAPMQVGTRPPGGCVGDSRLEPCVRSTARCRPAVGNLPLGTKNYDELFQKIIKSGFFRVRVDGQFLDLEQPPKLDVSVSHDIEVVIDRLVIREDARPRLAESLQLALKHGEGSVIAAVENSIAEMERDRWNDLPFCVHYACPHCHISYAELEPRTFSFNSPYGACPACEGTGCTECKGSRLRAEARNVTFAERRIYEICALPIEEALEFFQTLKKPPLPPGEGWGEGRLERERCMKSPHPNPLPKGEGTLLQIAETIIPQITSRLEFLCRIGLSYLTLSRTVDTLSGGELQRVRLAGGLGSGLTGVCYVLDEPTIGLHPRDNRRLIESIKELRERGNTVIVVEHDDAVIREADYRIEIGPGSGKYGGELVEHRHSREGENPENKVSRLDSRLRGNDGTCILSENVLRLENITTHNLKNVTVSFPLQKLTCVTGVSGSGKSSLVNETLVPLVRDYLRGTTPTPPVEGCRDSGGVVSGAEQIDKLIEVDQTPLGRSSRSNPATYSGMFDELRKLFASTKDAKRRGYKASRFSFNAGSGRCETCQGLGTQKIETNFLNDYYAVCPACNGKRFNRQTLAVKYKGKSIADVLEMPIEEAATFFANIPQIDRILQAMLRIGLGYVALGQPSSMLSGGESQRVKLATELAKSETGKTLYVLDEPTTGLHRSDVARLLNVLTDLTTKGNTVIVIEHNLDVMACSDWLIDLGPEGGERGGYLLATGTPEEIAELDDNATGMSLRLHDSAILCLPISDFFK